MNRRNMFGEWSDTLLWNVNHVGNVAKDDTSGDFWAVNVTYTGHEA